MKNAQEAAKCLEVAEIIKEEELVPLLRPVEDKEEEEEIHHDQKKLLLQQRDEYSRVLELECLKPEGEVGRSWENQKNSIQHEKMPL